MPGLTVTTFVATAIAAAPVALAMVVAGGDLLATGAFGVLLLAVTPWTATTWAPRGSKWAVIAGPFVGYASAIPMLLWAGGTALPLATARAVSVVTFAIGAAMVVVFTWRHATTAGRQAQTRPMWPWPPPTPWK